jgi:asparagine synthase (glutamine-hydrolysing)
MSAKYYTGRLKTFTLVFEGNVASHYDDRKFARLMSNRLGTDHVEIPMREPDLEKITGLVEFMEEPFANPTFYLSYMTADAAKKDVKFLFTGDGGDEFFGGYYRYKVLKYAAAMSLIPSFFKAPANWILELMPESANSLLPRHMKAFIRGMGVPFYKQYFRWSNFFSDEEKRIFLKPLLERHCDLQLSSEIVRQYLSEIQCGDILMRAQYVDLKTFLVDDVFTYNSMNSAAGLVTRLPYLDYRLAELNFKMPQAFKIKNGCVKYIFKDAFRDVLPDEILHAPKRGFFPPLFIWMERHFDSYFDKVLTKEYVEKYGVFNYDYISLLRAQHKARRRDNSMELFMIIMFDAWYKRHISG